MDLVKFAKSTSIGLPPPRRAKLPYTLGAAGLGLGGYLLYRALKKKGKKGKEKSVDLKKFAKLKVKELKNAIPESEPLNPKEDPKPIQPGAPVAGMSAVPPKRVISDQPK
jgi:hypothetical protein